MYMPDPFDCDLAGYHLSSQAIKKLICQ
jgi:hypothetical protein